VRLGQASIRDNGSFSLTSCFLSHYPNPANSAIGPLMRRSIPMCKILHAWCHEGFAWMWWAPRLLLNLDNRDWVWSPPNNAHVFPSKPLRGPCPVRCCGPGEGWRFRNDNPGSIVFKLAIAGVLFAAILFWF